MPDEDKDLLAQAKLASEELRQAVEALWLKSDEKTRAKLLEICDMLDRCVAEIDGKHLIEQIKDMRRLRVVGDDEQQTLPVR